MNTQTATNALSLNNIEVVYDYVSLAIKGVSLDVPEAAWWRCWGPMAPAKAPR